MHTNTHTRVCISASAAIAYPLPYRFFCFRRIRSNIMTTRLNFRPYDLDLISHRGETLDEITNDVEFLVQLLFAIEIVA